MDTRIISILTILALNFSTSFADNNVKYTELRPVQPVIMNLAPISPIEADFSDTAPEAPVFSFASLMPATPNEATFDDDLFTESVNSDNALPSILTPTTPAKADFEDTI